MTDDIPMSSPAPNLSNLRQVGSFGTSLPMFAHEPNKPIREILVALGGPRGVVQHFVKKSVVFLESFLRFTELVPCRIRSDSV